MKAVLFNSKDQLIKVTECPPPSPMKGEVLIHLNYAALNHLDLWAWKEAHLDSPVIPGSDGSGIVRAVGEGVEVSLIGKEVIINPALYWGDNEKIYSDDFQILGNSVNGTFTEYVVVRQEYIHQKPSHLTLKEAAALPLAALTAYRALFTKAEITPTDKVLITGIGGGAALYLLQMSVAIGATVYVTSSSDDKIQKATALGAKGGFNYKKEDWIEKAKTEAGGFDVIADSAGGNGFASLTEVANAGARIVLFGRTAGNINNLKPGVIYNKQLQIMGTVMGTQKEFASMLRFYTKHLLHPVIDKELKLESMLEALGYMDKSNQFGKVIIKIS